MKLNLLKYCILLAITIPSVSILAQEEGEIREEASESLNYYVGSSIAALFNSSVSKSWQLGWIQSPTQRWQLVLGVDNEVTSQGSKNKFATAPDSLPDDLQDIEFERNSRYLGLSYINEFKKISSISLRWGLGIDYVKFKTKRKFSEIRHTLKDDSLEKITAMSDSDGEVRSAQIIFESEFSIYKNLGLGFGAALNKSYEKSNDDVTTKTHTYINKVKVGEESETKNSTKGKSETLTTEFYNFFLRYYF